MCACVQSQHQCTGDINHTATCRTGLRPRPAQHKRMCQWFVSFKMLKADVYYITIYPKKHTEKKKKKAIIASFSSDKDKRQLLLTTLSMKHNNFTFPFQSDIIIYSLVWCRSISLDNEEKATGTAVYNKPNYFNGNLTCLASFSGSHAGKEYDISPYASQRFCLQSKGFDRLCSLFNNGTFALRNSATKSNNRLW